MDDLLQEAWLVFERCRHKVEFKGPKHFMAYFKTAFYRHCVDLAVGTTRAKSVGMGTAMPDLDLLETIDQELEVAKIVDRLPTDVQKLVRALLDEDRPPMLADGSGRETTNEYLSRLTGVPYADFRGKIVVAIQRY